MSYLTDTAGIQKAIMEFRTIVAHRDVVLIVTDAQYRLAEGAYETSRATLLAYSRWRNRHDTPGYTTIAATDFLVKELEINAQKQGLQFACRTPLGTRYITEVADNVYLSCLDLQLLTEEGCL